MVFGIHVLEFLEFLYMCCIRVEFELLKLLDILGYIYCEEYCSMGPRGRFFFLPYLYQVIDIGIVLYLGRAPRTNETLPDFHEKCRVTRHSRVFRGLTGSQRTPRVLGRHRSGVA